GKRGVACGCAGRAADWSGGPVAPDRGRNRGRGRAGAGRPHAAAPGRGPRALAHSRGARAHGRQPDPCLAPARPVAVWPADEAATLPDPLAMKLTGASAGLPLIKASARNTLVMSGAGFARAWLPETHAQAR